MRYTEAIYNLSLHEETTLYNESGEKIAYVIRVPGGWLYNIWGNSSGTFVPFDNDFQEVIK